MGVETNFLILASYLLNSVRDGAVIFTEMIRRNSQNTLFKRGVNAMQIKFGEKNKIIIKKSAT